MDLAFPPPPPAPPLTVAQQRGRLLLQRGSVAYGVGAFAALSYACGSGALSSTAALIISLILTVGPGFTWRGSEAAKHLTGVIGLFAAMIGLYMGVVMFFGIFLFGALSAIVGVLGCYVVKVFLINQDVKDFLPALVARRREIRREIHITLAPYHPSVETVRDQGPILLRRGTLAYLALAPSMVFDLITAPGIDFFSCFTALAILVTPFRIWRGSVVWARLAGCIAACATMAALSHALSVDHFQQWLGLVQFGLDFFFTGYVLRIFWWSPVVYEYLETLRAQISATK